LIHVLDESFWLCVIYFGVWCQFMRSVFLQNDVC